MNDLNIHSTIYECISMQGLSTCASMIDTDNLSAEMLGI